MDEIVFSFRTRFRVPIFPLFSLCGEEVGQSASRRIAAGAEGPPFLIFREASHRFGDQSDQRGEYPWEFTLGNLDSRGDEPSRFHSTPDLWYLICGYCE